MSTSPPPTTPPPPPPPPPPPLPPPVPPPPPTELKFDPRFFSKMRGKDCDAATSPQGYAALRHVKDSKKLSPRLLCPNDKGRPCSSVCTSSSTTRNHCAVDLVAAPGAIVYAPFCGVVKVAKNDPSKNKKEECGVKKFDCGCDFALIDIKAGERLSRFHLRVCARRVSSKRVCACLLTRHLQIRTRSSMATGSVSYTHATYLK